MVIVIERETMAKKYLRFAMRLKELREEAGVSMLELARAIGVSDAAVCKWENGLAEPKIGYIVELAEYFDCPIDYLIGVDGDGGAPSGAIKIMDAGGKPVKPVTGSKSVVLTVDELEIVDSYKKLSPDMRGVLKETLKTWKGMNGKPVKDKK